ncbi:MAG: zinc ribbon domain-containing protein [Candidatus Hodarchaeota archaeon]
MKTTGKCSKCQSRAIAANKVRSRLFGLGARVHIPTGNLRTSAFMALICLECGYTEFYADEKGLRNLNAYFQGTSKDKKRNNPNA